MGTGSPLLHKPIKEIERFNVYKKLRYFHVTKEKFRLITARRSRTKRCAFGIKKKNEKAKAKSFVARSSSAQPEKIQKFV